MITINGAPARWGTCDACRFAGWLRKKAMLKPGELNAITGDTSDALPILDLCVTCYSTPAGVLSDNATHQRLPDQEYLVK